MIKQLTSLRPGEQAEIVELKVGGYAQRRLMEMGITPGVTIEAVMKSAFKDPMAYRVRDTILAIRRQQAEQILIKT